MEPCPYCGASVRSGARFCTSCGRRLTPGAGDTPAAAEGTAAGQHTDAAPTAWETATSVSEQPSGGGDWLKRSPVASADLWPTATRSEESPPSRPASGEEPARANGEGDAPQHYGAAPDPEAAVAWPSSPWVGWASTEMETEQPSEPTGEVGDEASTATAAAADETTGEPSAAVDTAVPDAVPQPAATSGVVSSTRAMPVVAGDALGRALGLVDELRGLLPAVAGAAGTDLAALVSVLTTARDEAAGLDGEALHRAEAAVAAARERPREIDALLGLSSNLDALAEALHAHGRYAAAVERSLGILGGDGSAAESQAQAGEGAED